MSAGLIKNGDVELYYESRGDGPALLLLPGLLYDAEIFEAQIEHFQQRFRVIALDPRGQGRSSKPESGNTYADQGEDIAALISSLGLDGVTVLAWSAGCLALWSYVAMCGTAALKAIITVDMPPRPLAEYSDDWAEDTEAALKRAIARLDSASGVRAVFGSYARPEIVQHGGTAQLDRLTARAMAATRPDVLRSLYTDLMHTDLRHAAKMAEAQVPCLMFIAEHWAEIAVPYYRALCPNTAVRVLGGHMMFYEYAEAFNRQVDDFLNGEQSNSGHEA